MSLIFEALKKLDREKQAPERGFLVVGSSALVAGGRARVLPLVGVIVVAAAGGFFLARFLSKPAAAPAVEATPAATAPLTAPPSYAPPPLERMSSAPPPAPLDAAPSRPLAGAARAAATPAATVAPETLSLQAVSEQDGEPVAILNGQLARVGDVVLGFRVLRITPTAVEIQKNGERQTLVF